MRVLFVCLGNICRSPLAEAIFLHKVEKKGVADLFEVDSCGTSNYNVGDGPDPRTLSNAIRNGVRMEHIARQIVYRDVEYYDRIVVMDSKNYHNVTAFSDPAHHPKVVMMRAFDPEGTGDVPDPYYGGEEDFQRVFEMLDRAVDVFIDRLLQEKNR